MKILLQASVPTIADGLQIETKDGILSGEQTPVTVVLLHLVPIKRKDWRIDSSGNVGIGTDSPQHTLEELGSTAKYPISYSDANANALMTYSTTSGAAHLQCVADNNWTVQSGGVQRISVNSATGNVGIGGDSAFGKLTIIESSLTFPGTDPGFVFHQIW